MGIIQSATFEASNGERVAGYVFLNPDKTYGGWVASTASIGVNVFIAEGTVVCPSAVIEDNCVIDEGCFIGEGARVPKGTKMESGEIYLLDSA